MDDATSKIVLVLLLINRGEPLNNSYKLMRILEWKFKELNSKKILDEIKERFYASYTIIKGLHHYVLTSDGKNLINEMHDEAQKFLLQHYPSENSFIITLFDN